MRTTEATLSLSFRWAAASLRAFLPVVWLESDDSCALVSHFRHGFLRQEADV
jgi:hypothetical protein